MSSRTSRKSTPVKFTNTIITRNKSAQQTRQIRAKTKKTVKPLNNKIIDKTIDKVVKKPIESVNVTACDDNSLKNKVRTLVQLVEQVEYYPEKLKRDVGAKKVFLKPKHNFKIIASANKRKLVVPQKGGPNPLSKKHCANSPKSTKSNNIFDSNSRSEISMVDMVRLIEDTHHLSDEDFMEILTCPSPVWWEDPPDERYIEDPICSKDSERSLTKNNTDNNRRNEQKNVKNNTKTKQVNITRTNIDRDSLLVSQNRNNNTKITLVKNDSEKFNEKKQKLENILGNIKNVKIVDHNAGIKKNELKTEDTKSNRSTPVKSRRVSNSTDGDLSDLSFNEDEILKHLENLDIPIQQHKEEIVAEKDEKIEIYLKGSETDNEIIMNNEIKTEQLPIDSDIPDKLPPLTRKPDIKIEEKLKSENSDSCSDYNSDYVNQSNFRFISDDDIGLVESSGSNTDDIFKKVDNTSLDNTNSHDVDSIKNEQLTVNDKSNELSSKKAINDLTEYVTVYKIVSEDNSNKNTPVTNIDNLSDDNLGNFRGKLNSFFKKCKSNRRLKKSDSSLPAISVRDVKDLKMEKENSDGKSNGGNDEHRLKPCDYCVAKSENGTNNFSCDKCENSQTFACKMCNFHSNTKETYKKHISSCKDVARISWKQNYLINQT